MFSPTGYYAHYAWRAEEEKAPHFKTLPVASFNSDGQALACSPGGTLVAVQAYPLPFFLSGVRLYAVTADPKWDPEDFR